LIFTDNYADYGDFCFIIELLHKKALDFLYKITLYNRE